MQEKTDELYQEYVNGILPSLFSKEPDINDQPIWTVEKVYDGYILVDRNGNQIGDLEFDFVRDFSDGLAAVSVKGKHNYIDRNGNPHFDKWVRYDSFTDFSHGRAVVEKNNKWYVINKDGMQVSHDKYDHMGHFEDGINIVEREAHNWDKNKSNVIDFSGKELLPKWQPSIKYHDNYYNRVHYGMKTYNRNFKYIPSFEEDIYVLVCTTKELGDYRVDNKVFGGYLCHNSKDKFDIKYEPLVIYDKRYILCLDKEIIYMYDRTLNEYKKLGPIRDVEFDDKYVFDLKNDKVHLVYEGKILDITDYYNKKIRDRKEKIYIKKGVKFLSKEEFYIEREKKIKEEHEKEKRRKELEERKKRLEEDENKLENLLSDEEKAEKAYGIIESEAVHLVEEAADKIEFVESRRKTHVLTKVKSLWIYDEDDNHKEVNPIYFIRNFFNHLDLSDEDFSDAHISGLDLRNHNVMPFDPQKVYKRDLSNCNLEDIMFPVTTKFYGVNIKGAKFSTSKKSSIFSINANNLLEGIYDENTTLDGVPLVELIEENNNEKGRRIA